VSAIVVRRAEPADAEEVAQTFRSRGAASGTLQNPYPSVAQWKERLAADPSINYVFVAVADGAVVGHGGLHGNRNPRRQHVWGLGLSVREDWQGRGVGRQIMTTLIDLADNWLGALRVELTVFTNNAVAIALYEKFGFAYEGTHRAYALREGRYEDVLAMARLHPHLPRLPGAPAPAA
jgi:putative acetyltransferase